MSVSTARGSLRTLLVVLTFFAGMFVAPAVGAAPAFAAPANSSQLITVNSASAGSSYATLSAWQRGAGGEWVRVAGPVPARVGGSGIGAAREGSDTTPAGTYPLTVAFGSLANPGTRMPYFQTDPLDWWDENPSSPTYNLHVRQSASPGGASENLYYSGTAYDYAVNIGYNLARVPGAGSAIFLHVGTGDSTAGCVSIDQGTLTGIMRWLDPAQSPTIDIRVGAAVTPGPLLTSAQAGKAVAALYRGILGRNPDAGGAASYTGALLSGHSLGSAAQALVSSREYGVKLIATAYLGCLGRQPDPGGLTVYLASLGATTWSGLEGYLCSSGEAWNRAGGNANRWISNTFQALLGHPASAASLAYWQPVLARSGRAGVTTGVTHSAEYCAHQLNLIYLAMLGRAVDPSGVAARASAMPGRGVFTVPVALAGSAEFFSHSQG